MAHDESSTDVEEVRQWTYHRIGEHLASLDERLARIEAAIERLTHPSPAFADLREVASLTVVAVQLVQSFAALREVVYSLKEATAREHDSTRQALHLQLATADLAGEHGRA